MSNGPYSWGGAHAASQAPYHQQQQQQQQQQQSDTPKGAPPIPASMPALPPEVLAALQGIAPEQLGAIFHAFQSGLIPIPPAPPPPAQSAAPAAPPTFDPREQLGPAQSQNRDVDMGQEDGEVEDGEVEAADTPQTRGFLRTPPKGPRDPDSRRGSHQYQNHVHPQQSRPVPPQQPQPTIKAAAKAPAMSGTMTNVPRTTSKEAACKTFVLEMHKAGYKYEDIRREVNEEKLLQRIYKQLDLPIPSASSHPPTGLAKPVATKAPPTKATKPTPPKDRSEYLAKLQAAKLKKTEASKSSATATTAPAQPAQAQPPVSQPTHAQPVTAIQPSTDVSTSALATPPAVKTAVMTKDKTEEVRRRLEAIKAKRAAEQKAKLSSNAAQSTLSNEKVEPSQSAEPSASGLGAGLAEATASVATQQAVSLPGNTAAAPLSNGHQVTSSGLASPAVNQGFGLPGLFSSFVPPSISQPTSIQQYQAVPKTTTADHGSSITLSDANNAARSKQILGNRAADIAEERYIIAVSSDDEDDMDIDDSSDDEDETAAQQPSAPSTTEVPRPSNHPQAAASSPGTPNAYKRKMEEIEAFKQQIAEKEKRRKLLSQSMTPTTSTPNDPAALQFSAAASPGDPAAVKLARAQEKEALQRRLRELEALRANRNSDSPMTPYAVTSSLSSNEVSAEAHTRHDIVPTAPAPTTNETADQIDDEDDEDLYGDSTEAAQHQPSQNSRLPPFVDSQATTLSSTSRHSPTSDGAPVESSGSPDYALDGTATVEQRLDKTSPSILQTAPASVGLVDEVDDDDDDDLDNIYEPSAHIDQHLAQPSVPQPRAQGGLDSVEAMDTSEELSGDSDDGDDEAEHDHDSRDLGIDGSELYAQTTSSEHEVSADPSESGLGSSHPLRGLDMAPELQAASEEISSTGLQKDEVSTTRYTPYESPLRRFKDYRYHPEFTNTVSGGFKSLSFNHQIDPVKPVCPYEIEQGRCEVPNCGYQHFQEMVLHDNDLLRLMGTERTPARNPEEDKRWKEGLFLLIRGLRTTDIGRDAGLIAQRIAEYRRSFVNDPTRVVLLDD
ncbi:hypothetical protein CERZMDRAFT_88849 [Cercospora zeae-maydis SCOH1-5]|uniref:Putative zinc-finger domain-containing protein n=1 Tax=Cercospora zeae-maydis SCOH1-5 TaxID=717836 RepID=A0A6A6F3I1_9PEZI|nr:hypothetical protein CERZMDRAFT_88849 [Cercospora zeae-maydis SCOH1-5]